jgi:2-iminobutanoate/2-iminopropanoate deaminase
MNEETPVPRDIVFTPAAARPPVVLADEDDFAGMNEEWLRWFPADPPARQGAKLPARIPGLKISIAAIAEA